MEIAVRGLNGLLMIALPLALGVFLVRRLRLSWGIFGVGGLTFVASQVVHLPFNHWVLQPFLMRFGLGPESGPAGLVAVALMLGLSAGVFEEGARYLAYRYGLRRAREWSQGVLFGAGHGGVEAILLGVLALVGLMQAVAYRGVDLATLLPPGQVAAAQAQLAAYWESPWYFALLGALERAERAVRPNHPGRPGPPGVRTAAAGLDGDCHRLARPHRRCGSRGGAGLGRIGDGRPDCHPGAGQPVYVVCLAADSDRARAGACGRGAHASATHRSAARRRPRIQSLCGLSRTLDERTLRPHRRYDPNSIARRDTDHWRNSHHSRAPRGRAHRTGRRSW